MYNKLFGRQKKFEVNSPEITYKVHYLGNVMTSLIKGTFNHGHANAYRQLNSSSENDQTQKRGVEEGENEESQCESLSDEDQFLSDMLQSTDQSKLNTTFIDKSVKILWDNHVKHQGHAGIKMRLTLTQGGLKVNTKDHGLTEYYGHRIHLVKSHELNQKLIVWVYQHVGKNLKSEIRCHAALCEKVKHSKNIEAILTDKLQRTFLEYKREKKRMQNSRLCNSKNGGILQITHNHHHSVAEAAGHGVGGVNFKKTQQRAYRSITHNYKPPVQHGMCSAPKLDDVIEEDEDDLLSYNEILIDDSSYRTPPRSDEDEANTATFNQIEMDDDDDDDLESENENDIEENLFDESVDFNYYNRVEANHKSSHYASLCAATGQQQQLVLSSSSSATSSSMSSTTNNSSSLIVPSKYRIDCMMPKNEFTLDQKQYVEVSYDYLSDLSKIESQAAALRFRSKTETVSKSFISRNLRPPNLSSASLIDPFKRTNFSKSFTAFTSRFNSKPSPPPPPPPPPESSPPSLVVVPEKSFSVNSSVTTNKKTSKIEEKFSNLNLNSASTSSSLSSPALSTCSYSSGASSSSFSNNNKQCSNNNDDYDLVISL